MTDHLVCCISRPRILYKWDFIRNSLEITKNLENEGISFPEKGKIRDVSGFCLPMFCWNHGEPICSCVRYKLNPG